MNNKKDFI